MYDFFYKELNRSSYSRTILDRKNKVFMDLDELKNILLANSLPSPEFQLYELSNRPSEKTFMYRTICGAKIVVSVPPKVYKVWVPGYVKR